MKVLTLFRHKRTLYIAGSVLLLAIAFTIGYRYWMAPTRILIVNPLPAQAADIVLNNDSRNIEVTCIQTENLESFKGYDAVVLYGRSLNLNDRQMKEAERAASAGIPLFTISLRNFNTIINRNITPEQEAMLMQYFGDACRQNYRNGLRYHRHAGTLKLLMPLFAYPTIYFIIKNMENTSRLRKPLNNTCVKKVFSMKTDLKSLSSPESVFQWKVTEHM